MQPKPKPETETPIGMTVRAFRSLSEPSGFGRRSFNKSKAEAASRPLNPKARKGLGFRGLGVRVQGLGFRENPKPAGFSGTYDPKKEPLRQGAAADKSQKAEYVGFQVGP